MLSVASEHSLQPGGRLKMLGVGVGWWDCWQAMSDSIVGMCRVMLNYHVR